MRGQEYKAEYRSGSPNKLACKGPAMLGYTGSRERFALNTSTGGKAMRTPSYAVACSLGRMSTSLLEMSMTCVQRRPFAGWLSNTTHNDNTDLNDRVRRAPLDAPRARLLVVSAGNGGRRGHLGGDRHVRR